METVFKHIQEIGQLVKVGKGESIYQVGEHIHSFYYLEQGMVKLAKDTLEGHSHTLAFIESSGTFGYLDYLHGRKEYTQDAVSLTGSIFYSIPISYLNKSPKIDRIIFESTARQLTEAHEIIYALSNMTVPERLSWFLKKLAKRKDGVLVIDLPLTHEELSNVLGCSRQKVTTFLSKWKKEGLILYERGMITIKNEEKLP